MKNFEKMTVVQLKEFAEQSNIDISGVKTKTKIIAILTDTDSNISVVEENDPTIIGSDKTIKEKINKVSNAKMDNNGVTTVGSADTFKDKKFETASKTSEMKNKIAVFSEKNVSWYGLGNISKGYNIVTKEAAEKWLTRKGIREADPKEVAAHYGL